MGFLEDGMLPTVEISNLKGAEYLDRWESREAYAAHVEGVVQTAKERCERGAGSCGLALVIEDFTNGERERRATVTGSCRNAANCPNLKLTVDAAFEVPGRSDRLPHAGWKQAEPKT